MWFMTIGYGSHSRRGELVLYKKTPTSLGRFSTAKRWNFDSDSVVMWCMIIWYDGDSVCCKLPLYKKTQTSGLVPSKWWCYHYVVIRCMIIWYDISVRCQWISLYKNHKPGAYAGLVSCRGDVMIILWCDEWSYDMLVKVYMVNLSRHMIWWW